MGAPPTATGIAKSHPDRLAQRVPAPDATRHERTGPGPDGRARLRNLVVREGRRTGKLQVRLVSTDGELDASAFALALSAALGDRLSGVLWTRSRSLAETTAGGETELVWGEAELAERLGELDLRISAQAFFQTNTEMAELLYGVVGEYAALGGWERVYDLYCGIGTIALTLAPRAGELWGIELVEAGGRRRDRRGAAQRCHQRPLLRRRHPARPARAGCARRAPGRARRRSAPRRALQESGPAHRRGLAETDRVRLLQPHHARPQRGRARRGRLDVAARCAPWTCSPKRITSSASPCSSATSRRRPARVGSRRCAPPPSATSRS